MKNTLYYSLIVAVLTWCEPLLPTQMTGSGATVTAAEVTGYTLVNADNNTDILPLTPGMIIDLATLPTRNVNIRANTSPLVVGSVVFNLSGAQNQVTTEDVIPYALFSDYNGNYFSWNPPVGSYTLLATPFDGPDGTNTAGTSLTINFSVINTVGAVSSFTLVNADKNSDILTLVPGMTLDLATLPTHNVNVRANTSPAVGSVVFTLAGDQTHSATENVVPFALFSDFQGQYFGWTPTAGAYSLTATPFAGADGTGTQGIPLTTNFNLVGSPPLAVQLTVFTVQMQGDAVQLAWSTASEENNREFEVQRSTDGKEFRILNRITGHGTTAVAHDYRYRDEHLPGNVTMLYYRLRQIDTDGKMTFSPVRSVALSARATTLKVFSSPFADGLVQYVYSGPIIGTEQIAVYNMLGQRQRQFVLTDSGMGVVPVSGLSSGSYVLRLVNTTGQYSGRFVLP